MATKKIILLSIVIVGVWGVLHINNTNETALSDVFETAGIAVPEIDITLPDEIESLVTVPDVVERKTNALTTSYEKITTSLDQMLASIEQMKAAANTFQESKNQMLNDFKDLPTDLLEANAFEVTAPVKP